MWENLFINLVGGLALFLYGIELMGQGMRKVAGDQLRSFSATLMKNRFVGLFVGIFVTLLLQSSSTTTVMLISFVNAELIGFVQTIGVMLGAGIGSTISVQLIAFKFTDYALLMVAVGSILKLFSKQENFKYTGETILGFGMIFFGIKLMGDAMTPLRNFEPFMNTLKGLEHPIAGILFGAFFTAVIQSSSAFTALLVVFAQQGLISLEAGVALVLGAHLGTSITAVMAGSGTSPNAKRVMVGHVVLRVAAVILFVFWIPQFAWLVRKITSLATNDAAREIANAHSIFNIIVAIVFLPFVNLFANIVYLFVPKSLDDNDQQASLRYLDDAKISLPGVSLNLARAEISRMAEILGHMLDAIIIPFTTPPPWKDPIFQKLSLIDGIKIMENKIDILEEKIAQYLTRIIAGQPTPEQVNEAYGLMSIIKDMESIGDIINKNIVPLVHKKKVLHHNFSEQGQEELKTFHTKICKQISRMRFAFRHLDSSTVAHVLDKSEFYVELESRYRLKHLNRFVMQQSESVVTHDLHLDLLDDFKQINVYVQNIAKTILNSILHDEQYISKRYRSTPSSFASTEIKPASPETPKEI